MRRVVRVWRAGLVVEVRGAYGAGRPSPLLASCGCRNGLQRERERETDRQTEETLENLGANLSQEAAPTKAPRSAVSPVPVPWPS